MVSCHVAGLGKFKKSYLPARPGVGADRTQQRTGFARANRAGGQILEALSLHAAAFTYSTRPDKQPGHSPIEKCCKGHIQLWQVHGVRHNGEVNYFDFMYTVDPDYLYTPESWMCGKTGFTSQEGISPRFVSFGGPKMPIVSTNAAL